jgi:hypothetical protein
VYCLIHTLERLYSAAQHAGTTYTHTVCGVALLVLYTSSLQQSALQKQHNQHTFWCRASIGASVDKLLPSAAAIDERLSPGLRRTRGLLLILLALSALLLLLLLLPSSRSMRLAACAKRSSAALSRVCKADLQQLEQTE